MHQRVAFFGLDSRRRRDLLQIVPEHPPPQPHRDGGETTDRYIQCGLQRGHVYRLAHGGGKTEQVVPVAATGRRVDLCGVIQLHPAQLAFTDCGFIEEPADLLEVGHIFIEAVEDIGVPALRRGDHFAFAAAVQQPLVQAPGVVQQDLIPADKKQTGREAGEVAEQRRNQRLLLGGAPGGVAIGIEAQQLLREGGVLFPVEFVAFRRAGQIDPRGNGDKTGRHRHSQLLQLEAQGADEPAAGAFAAQHDLLRAVALIQKIAVGFQGVLHGCGVGVFRGQPVGGTQHPHPEFIGQRSPEALGVIQIAAGIAAAVQIENDAAAALIPGDEPSAPEPGKEIIPDDDVLFMDGLHQLAQLILTLSGHLQRTVCHKGLEKGELRVDQFGGKSHRRRLLSADL